MNAPAFIASALACFVEMIEALTIVLAVASVRGRRAAWAGAVAAFIVLFAFVAGGGAALRHIDLHSLQLVIGVLLLWFGVHWLRKAILRSAGKIPMHDEDRIYRREVEALQKGEARQKFGVDLPAAATAFNGVLMEGIEVVFIVLAVGSTERRLDSAILGAGGALAAVAIIGILLRAPLSRVPENTLKFIVGVMLVSIGTLWVGEGMGLRRPLGDWALTALMACYFAVSFAVVSALKRKNVLQA